jgi:CheY-like chemotaxis protein
MDGLAVEILLVEDSDTDLELTLRALKKANVANRIEVARDGSEALDFLFGEGKHAGRAADNPRLVLLDLKLPKVDGLDVLKSIRGNPTTRTIPVVILTSSQEQRDIVESYNLGVNSYIVKPVEFDGFMAAVVELGLYWMLLNRPPPPVA